MQSIFSGLFDMEGRERFLSKLNSIQLISVRDLIYIFVCIIFTFFCLIFVKEKIKKSLHRTLGKYYRGVDGEVFNETIPFVYVFDKVVTYFSIIMCIIICIRIAGVKAGELTFLVGGASVVILVGLQEFLKNFMSGIMILFENSIRIGDIIDLATIKIMPRGATTLAWVSEIRTRTTLLTTLDGKEIIIPNIDIVNNAVVNVTLSNPIRRVHFPFFIPASVNFLDLKEKIIEKVSSHPVCLKNPAEPAVWIKGIFPGYIHCEVVVWINQKRLKTSPLSLVGTMLISILDENDALVKGCSLPQYTIKGDEFSGYESGF